MATALSSSENNTSTDSVQLKTEEFLKQFETPQAPMNFHAFPFETPVRISTETGGIKETQRFVSPPQPTAYPVRPIAANSD
jgi:hypothetical protein